MRTTTLALTFTVLFFASAAESADERTVYVPPAGIPAPEFGINETHWMYQGKWFAAGGFTYKDAGHGPYTHYVDNTHPRATNEGNPYGTPDKPRRDIFDGLTVKLPPGSVVEVHGGPYKYSDWRKISAKATRANPVFVRAVSSNQKVRLLGDLKPHTLRLDTSWFVIENFEFFNLAFVRTWGPQHHISLRNLEIHNRPGQGGASGTAISVATEARDCVIYRCHVHHNEQFKTQNGERIPVDCHGLNLSSHTERVWILNNHFHHNSGDSVQGSHRASVAPRFVYIGGNTFHEDRENAVDLKTIRDVIVSQNKLYGYKSSETSVGDAIVVGSNGCSPDEGYGPDNVWLLFNEIHACRTGIRVEGVYHGWIVGNYVHDIQGSGIVLDIDPDSLSLAIVGNTVAAVREGIHHHWMDGIGQVSIDNNLITDCRLSALTLGTGVGKVTKLRSNLFWSRGKRVAFIDNLNTQDPDADFAARTFYAPGSGAVVRSWNKRGIKLTGGGNVIGDPAFVGSKSAPVPGPTSAAIDRAGRSEAYDVFEETYGVSIRVDFTGRPRTNDNSTDIGAFEMR